MAVVATTHGIDEIAAEQRPAPGNRPPLESGLSPEEVVVLQANAPAALGGEAAGIVIDVYRSALEVVLSSTEQVTLVGQVTCIKADFRVIISQTTQSTAANAGKPKANHNKNKRRYAAGIAPSGSLQRRVSTKLPVIKYSTQIAIAATSAMRAVARRAMPTPMSANAPAE